VDRDLVEQAKRGDREAFALLARTHADSLFAVAQRILRDVDRAEDATQQTLVIAWRELRRLRDPDRFGAWLHRILVHACYAELARTRRWSANVRVLAPTDYVPADELSVTAMPTVNPTSTGSRPRTGSGVCTDGSGRSTSAAGCWSCS
jgi:DNA-directed RNA polymerase specialized sigma24 family protein